jgi:hypothetical protein
MKCQPTMLESRLPEGVAEVRPRLGSQLDPHVARVFIGGGGTLPHGRSRILLVEAGDRVWHTAARIGSFTPGLQTGQARGAKRQ